MDILDLDISEFRKKYFTLSSEEKNNIIKNDKLKTKSNDFILFIFNSANEENKLLFLNDDDLVFKLLIAVLSKNTKMNVIKEEYQKIIINKPSIFLKFNKRDFFELLKSIKVDIYKELINNLNNYIYENDIKTNNELFVQMKNFYNNYPKYKNDKNNESVSTFRVQLIFKYNLHDYEFLDHLTSSFGNNKRNILELSRIETKEQLFIYLRLGVVVNKKLFKKEMLDKYNISIELIKSLNSKHIIKIMNELSKKGDIDDTELLITSIKMYCLFGLDNSLKVIHDKFTYSTPASLDRASTFQFITERRDYRLAHPDEFFNYGLLEKVRKSINSNNPSILKKILFDKSYTISLFSELKENYRFSKDEDRYMKYLNQRIKEEINYREEKLKSEYQEKFYLNYKKRDEVSPKELFNLFKFFDPILTTINENGNVCMDPDLEKFLLGNTKVDNDCLLRIILNKQGLDYDNELINIINCFHEIQNKRNEIKLNSKYSLLDILDIYKTIQYKLKTDELDIPLSMMSKTALSKQHLNVSLDEALKNFKRVFKEHKKKCSSSIPRVKGITKDNYSYKVLDKNDPELITCGIDTGSCFKPGGPGGVFYEYCLTSPYADVIAIKDQEDKIYIVPVVRNGNGIYGNGIDPEGIEKSKIPFILDALKKCYTEIIKHSDNKEKIDFCTVTGLHDYITPSNGFEKFEIKEPPMIGEYFYSDLCKDEMTSYVIAGDASKVEKYVPEIMFNVPRTKSYIYSPEQIENKLIIEQKINEIEYQSIDCKNISDEDKERLKEEYKPINVNDYTYVVCNEDWYLAINDSYELKSAVLPYDSRAQQEFFTELTKMRTNNMNIGKIR